MTNDGFQKLITAILLRAVKDLELTKRGERIVLLPPGIISFGKSPYPKKYFNKRGFEIKDNPLPELEAFFLSTYFEELADSVSDIIGVKMEGKDILKKELKGSK